MAKIDQRLKSVMARRQAFEEALRGLAKSDLVVAEHAIEHSLLMLQQLGRELRNKHGKKQP